MFTHGLKLKKFLDVVMPPEVNAIVVECDLLPLVDCFLTMLNGQLSTTFIGRWHKETYFFHLPFGEMMIKLDDVSSLFHIPLDGSFLNAYFISQKTTRMTVVQYLGVTEEQMIEEFRYIRGNHFHIS